MFYIPNNNKGKQALQMNDNDKLNPATTEIGLGIGEWREVEAVTTVVDAIRPSFF